MVPAPSLNDVLDVAGGVLTTRYGRPVAAHFGSPAGELAVCVRGVGVCDRSELAVLALEGQAEQLIAALSGLIGHPLAKGGSASVGGAWWCRESANLVVVVCGPRDASRLLGRLRAQASRSPDLTVVDRSHEHRPIGVVGAAAPAVLAALGAYGPERDPGGVAPVVAGRVADVEVLWLLESERSALILAPRMHASRVWKAIEDAGRPVGITCVGRDAFDRYMLLDRRRVLVAVAGQI